MMALLFAGGSVASAQVPAATTTTGSCPTDYTGVTTPGCTTTTTAASATTTTKAPAVASAPGAGSSGIGTSSGTGTTVTNSGPLAFTGSNIFRLLLAAAVLLLVGLVLTAIARERRRIRR
jgi:alkaline phosphatase